mmetsp:Transcript_120526/g.180016  ORF Transcript_120526/g.180016 Transcript_120526/m.180016 type:complete len:189 (-) Transcript_120526:45-611(-)
MPPLKLEIDTYPNEWKIGVLETLIQEPFYVCLGCVFAPCFAFKQRSRILHDNLENYRCCGQLYCDSCNLSEDRCPAACLCMETCFCFPCAVVSNRYLIQREYQIRTSMFDKVIIMVLAIARIIFRIVQIFVPMPKVDCLCDCLYSVVTGCIQAQQEAELDYQRSPAKMKMEYNENASLIQGDAKGNYV